MSGRLSDEEMLGLCELVTKARAEGGESHVIVPVELLARLLVFHDGVEVTADASGVGFSPHPSPAVFTRHTTPAPGARPGEISELD
jgi:hypothetical protein